MGQASYNDVSENIRIVRRYFTGLTTLRANQVLGLSTTASATDADPKLRLGYAVTVLTSSNLKMPGGIVVPSSAGKVGPCYVDVYLPASGDVFLAETDGTADIAAGDSLEPDNTLGALIKGTSAVAENLYVALQANAADAAKTSILVLKV